VYSLELRPVCVDVRRLATGFHCAITGMLARGERLSLRHQAVAPKPGWSCGMYKPLQTPWAELLISAVAI